MGKKRNRDELQSAVDAGSENRQRKDEKKRRKKQDRELRNPRHQEKKRNATGPLDAAESARQISQGSEPHSGDVIASPEAFSLVPCKPVFFEKRFELTIALYPIDLGNVARAVENSLRSLLLRHSDQMGGVLLAFSDVTILNDGKGRILNDLPHVHYAASTKALLFRPEIGCTLVGSIKESFPSHLSATVFHYVHASIPADALYENGFTFDKESLEWLTNDSRPVSLGCEVQFTVNSLHESGGIISLEGTKPSFIKP
jgi:DNA-directed RNA polymerase subunit E'/Rpb7